MLIGHTKITQLLILCWIVLQNCPAFQSVTESQLPVVKDYYDLVDEVANNAEWINGSELACDFYDKLNTFFYNYLHNNPLVTKEYEKIKQEVWRLGEKIFSYCNADVLVSYENITHSILHDTGRKFDDAGWIDDGTPTCDLSVQFYSFLNNNLHKNPSMSVLYKKFDLQIRLLLANIRETCRVARQEAYTTGNEPSRDSKILQTDDARQFNYNTPVCNFYVELNQYFFQLSENSMTAYLYKMHEPEIEQLMWNISKACQEDMSMAGPEYRSTNSVLSQNNTTRKAYARFKKNTPMREIPLVTYMYKMRLLEIQQVLRNKAYQKDTSKADRQRRTRFIDNILSWYKKTRKVDYGSVAAIPCNLEGQLHSLLRNLEDPVTGDLPEIDESLIQQLMINMNKKCQYDTSKANRQRRIHLIDNIFLWYKNTLKVDYDNTTAILCNLEDQLHSLLHDLEDLVIGHLHEKDESHIQQLMINMSKRCQYDTFKADRQCRTRSTDRAILQHIIIHTVDNAKQINTGISVCNLWVKLESFLHNFLLENPSISLPYKKFHLQIELVLTSIREVCLDTPMPNRENHSTDSVSSWHNTIRKAYDTKWNKDDTAKTACKLWIDLYLLLRSFGQYNSIYGILQHVKFGLPIHLLMEDIRDVCLGDVSLATRKARSAEDFLRLQRIKTHKANNIIKWPEHISSSDAVNGKIKHQNYGSDFVRFPREVFNTEDSIEYLTLHLPIFEKYLTMRDSNWLKAIEPKLEKSFVKMYFNSAIKLPYIAIRLSPDDFKSDLLLSKIFNLNETDIEFIYNDLRTIFEKHVMQPLTLYSVN